MIVTKTRSKVTPPSIIESKFREAVKRKPLNIKVPSKSKTKDAFKTKVLRARILYLSI